MGGGRRAAMVGDELRLQRPPQIDAAGELRALDAGRQVIDLQLGIAAGGLRRRRGADAVGRADGERGIARAEKAGRERGLIEGPVGRDADVVRHGVVFAGEGLGKRRADRRILNRPLRLLAGADDVRAAAVVAFLGAEAADDAEPIGHFAELGQMLAEPQAGDFGGDFLELAAVGVPRLHVERVGLRRARRSSTAGCSAGGAWDRPRGRMRGGETSRWRSYREDRARRL